MKQRTLWILSGIITVYLAVSFYFFGTHGVRLSGDSGIYTHGAKAVLEGTPLIGKYTSYMGYVWIVAFFVKCGLGLKGLIAFQIILAVPAALALFDIGKRLHSPACGLWAMGLYLCNPDIAQWDLHILTEAVYIPLLIFLVWSVYRYTENPDAGLSFWGVLGLAALTALVRPNGWLVVPAVITLGLCHRFRLYKQRWLLLIVSSGLVIGGAGLISYLHRSTQGETPHDLFRQEINGYDLLSRGVIVWGYPEGAVTMPPVPAGEELTLSNGIRYVFRHFGASARVAILRLWAELSHLRPFYSRAHNAASLLFLIPVYVLAAIGFRQCRLRLFQFTLAAIIFMHLLPVALIAADWDGRFLLYFLPLLILMAAFGLSTLLGPSAPFLTEN